jgi:hypothetical protein
MTVLPLVLVPVYLVPLFFVLHLASLAKLSRETGAVSKPWQLPTSGTRESRLPAIGETVRSSGI